jgi:hypothetical protein
LFGKGGREGGFCFAIYYFTLKYFHDGAKEKKERIYKNNLKKTKTI